MENPNEYDDELFVRGSLELHSAVETLWEAGASEDDIASELSNAINNVTG